MARFLLLSVAVVALLAVAAEAGFYDEFDVVGKADHILFHEDSSGKVDQIALTLDRKSGSGFISNDKYLYGEFSVQMKLVHGNSAGTVTSFYLSSGENNGPKGHDEIDIEFMGNRSGDPYVMNTNVWASGDGKKEHQFNLWFDPSADYHTYKIIWNPKNIIFQVDNVTVRSFNKYSDLAYPSSNPMRVHATLWDGSYWATLQGNVTISWNNAPFVVSYRGFHADGCLHNNGVKSSCPDSADWMDREPEAAELADIAWAERTCMSYNYCADGWRFPKGFPGECGRK